MASRFRLLLFAATTAVVAAASPGCATSHTPEAAPPTGLSVKEVDVRVVPDDVTSSRRKAATDEISNSLRRLYARAFMKGRPLPVASPRPSPLVRLHTSMTKAAIAALKKSPNVFDAGGDLVVFYGSLTYGGLVTFGTRKPVEALLEVDFTGRAAPQGRSVPVARVHQRGTILLHRTSTTWLVDGFDLRIETRPQPSPTPSGS